MTITKQWDKSSDNAVGVEMWGICHSLGSVAGDKRYSGADGLCAKLSGDHFCHQRKPVLRSLPLPTDLFCLP